MRRELLVVAFVGLMAVGCSDPGGGGGGVQSDTFVFVPDGSDASGEVSDGTSDTSGCTNGTRRCNGQVAQQCVNNAFQDLFECPSTQTCEAGACKASETSGDTTVTTDTANDTTIIHDTTPNDTASDPCAGRECGSNGQGGSCGSCDFPDTCNAQGVCVAGCTPSCGGKECGSDGCGGNCGTCGSDEQCVQGSCQSTQVCDCNGAMCGLDNCGNSCGSCGGQATCSGGRCVSNQSGGTCTDIIDCIYGDVTGCAATAADDDEFQTCATACEDDASQNGVDEFEAYLGCLDNCPQPDDNPNTTADDLAYGRCTYQECSDVEAFCVLDGSGNGTCLAIFDCFDTCADGDSDCIKGCYEAATPAAQVALWGLNDCVGVECPDTNDADCVDAALQDRCSEFVAACNAN